MDEQTSSAPRPPFQTPGEPQHTPLEQVHEGMTVVDSAGQRVGTVEYVQMGDPDAVTTQGNEGPASGVLEPLRRAVLGGGADAGGPDVPEPLRSQLLRSGFIRVDGPGLFDADRYVRGDLVGEVSQETVTLRVTTDRLGDAG